MRPIHTDDLNMDSQGCAQKSSVSRRPQCVCLFKGELSQRPIGDPAGRIDTGFYFSAQKEKERHREPFSCLSHIIKESYCIFLQNSRSMWSMCRSDLLPHLRPSSLILHMYVCVHVHACMHTHSLLTQICPAVDRVLCSDTDPACDTFHCTAGLASLIATEAQGSTSDHADIRDMFT